MPEIVTAVWGAIASAGMFIAAVKVLKDTAAYEARKEAEGNGDQDA